MPTTSTVCPSALRRDRSHPILLLISHGQVNSTECLNPPPPKKKPKQSAAQRMILSKSCETWDHRMSLLWEWLVNEWVAIFHRLLDEVPKSIIRQEVRCPGKPLTNWRWSTAHNYRRVVWYERSNDARCAVTRKKVASVTGNGQQLNCEQNMR